MKNIVLLLLCSLFAPLAYGQETYNVTATMPLTEGTPDGCQLYLDGAPVGAVEPCGTPAFYPGLIIGDGLYEFQYSLVVNGAETALSPVQPITIVEGVADPTQPPSIMVECTDSDGDPIECPSHISITIS